MSTVFISRDIWPQLTKAVRGSRQRCSVAVAYFGKGASSLLPLPKGSRLVVDASERAIASGQTCPADLSKLVKRGVAVFSVPNLHAKVFVLGRAAYVGSANVSKNSAAQLIETVVRTTEPKAVADARKFVHEHCLHELTPKVLKHLATLYRPPLLPGGKRGKKRAAETAKSPTLPCLRLAQLELEDWPDRDQQLHDSGMAAAKKRRKHPRSFELDSYRDPGRCWCRAGDVVIQVLDEGGGNVLVSPPGNVLYVRSRRDGKRMMSFVYLERPARRRKPLRLLARRLGHGALKKLRKDGVVRDAAFAQALLNAWAD